MTDSDKEYEDKLKKLRNEIDGVDKKLVESLAPHLKRRMEIVEQIGKLKKGRGERDFRNPRRAYEVKQRWQNLGGSVSSLMGQIAEVVTNYSVEVQKKS